MAAASKSVTVDGDWRILLRPEPFLLISSEIGEAVSRRCGSFLDSRVLPPQIYVENDVPNQSGNQQIDAENLEKERTKKKKKKPPAIVVLLFIWTGDALTYFSNICFGHNQIGHSNHHAHRDPVIDESKT